MILRRKYIPQLFKQKLTLYFLELNFPWLLLESFWMFLWLTQNFIMKRVPNCDRFNEFYQIDLFLWLFKAQTCRLVLEVYFSSRLDSIFIYMISYLSYLEKDLFYHFRYFFYTFVQVSLDVIKHSHCINFNVR